MTGKLLFPAAILLIGISNLGGTNLADPNAGGVALFRMTRIQSSILMTNDRNEEIGKMIPDFVATPIAVFQGGNFIAPTDFCVDKPAWQEFEKKYIHGTLYSYYAGTLRGTVELNPIHGKNAVEIFGSQRVAIPPTYQERAIASNSDRLGRSKVMRRSANESERAEFVKVARRILTVDLKVPEDQLRKLQTDSVIATDLGNGKLSLIGTAVATEEKTHHALLLVVEQAGSVWKPILADYLHSDPAKNPLVAMRFVDQLDIDGDGIDEIVADNIGRFGFKIYGYRESRWRVLYEDRRDGKGCVQQVK